MPFGQNIEGARANIRVFKAPGTKIKGLGLSHPHRIAAHFENAL